MARTGPDSPIDYSNGLEAIACFETQKNNIRLVLTDTDMPFMDGRNANSAILKINPNVPIIVASGTSDDERRSRPNDSPRIITLQKPYGVEQLLGCIGKA